MRKTIITALILVICSGMMFGQSGSGKIFYTVTHDWVKKISAVEYMSKSQREQYEYMWGSNSEYTQKSFLEFSPEAYRYEEIKEDESTLGYSWRSEEYYIFRDMKSNSTYDVIRTLNKLYVVEDSIRNPKWKILNDLREIAGHMCMNASYYDELKMNKITAWFALDWPVPMGPERFGGLPGVILEISINNGAQIISADKIELYESDSIIAKPIHKKKVKRINEEQYLSILRKHIESSKKEERPYFWSVRY
jgi:GLPGLI family protein